MKTRITATALCVLMASTAFASPANKAAIPDTAKWAIHVDVSAITASGLATGLMDIATGKDSALPADKIAKAVEGWKFLSNVHSVTLYGPGPNEAEAIALITAKYVEEQVKKMAKIDAQSATTAHGNHVIYTFAGKDRAGVATSKYGCFYDNATIVAGGSLVKVKEALDVLDGKARGLARTHPLSEMLTPSKGSFMIVGAVDVNEQVAAAAKLKAVQANPAGAMMTKVQDMRMEVGQIGENVYATANATMTTEEDAKTIATMLNGLIAMATFRAADNKDLAKVLQAIQVDQKGKNVGVGMELPVKMILDKIGQQMAANAMKLGV